MARRISPTNVDLFNTILDQFELTVNNDVLVGYAVYPDCLVPGLFRGIDTHGRAFINIPVEAWGSLNGTTEENKEVTILNVCQRYSDDDSVFVIGNGPRAIHRDDFFGSDMDVFDNLELLLYGKEVHLRDDCNMELTIRLSSDVVRPNLLKTRDRGTPVYEEGDKSTKDESKKPFTEQQKATLGKSFWGTMVAVGALSIGCAVGVLYLLKKNS